MDNVLLGRLAEAGPPIPVLHDLSLEHVIAMVGKRGSGKSYTLGTLLEGLCTKPGKSPIGQVSGKRAGLLFDTLGIFQWMDIPLSPDSVQEIVREQYALRNGWSLKGTPELNVSVWVPQSDIDQAQQTGHQGFTISYCDFTASDWGYLLGLDIYQDRMGQLLNDAYIKVTLEGWIDETSQHSAKQDYDINDLLNCVRMDREIIENYQTETRRAVVQQLSTYARNPLFNTHGTLLSDLLRPGKLSVLVMNKMSDELRFTLITTLIRRIMHTRIEASEIEKGQAIRGGTLQDSESFQKDLPNAGVPPCWIAVDEAQNFLPSEKRSTATDILVKLVREGRNYGISFVVTTQQPTAIDQRIMSQVDTLISHKLTVQTDIDYIRRNLKSNLPEDIKYANSTLAWDSLLRSLDTGQAVISNTEAERTYIVDIRPRMSVHGGF
jgi:hypothetical protein